MAVDKAEIHAVWRLLPRISVPGRLEHTVIRWMAKKKGIVRGDFAANVSQLIAAANTFDGWDFYIAPNPTLCKTGIRHTAKDVTHWSWFFIDIDPKEPEYNMHLAAGYVHGTLEALVKQELTPTIVYSGRGIQLWYRLLDMATSSVCGTCNTDYRKDVQNTMRWWLHRLDKKVGTIHGCVIDTTCSDLPRVMRCPGTLNSKTGNRSFILQHGAQNMMLGALLIKAVPEEELKVAIEDGVATSGLPWQEYFHHLTTKAKDFIIVGKQEPGRHEAAWHTARKLVEVGATRGEVQKALDYGNLSCTNGLGVSAPLSDSDIKHILDTACRDMV